MKMKVTLTEFPDTHEIVGEFGPWQKRIFILIFFSYVICVWQDMAITFLAPSTEFWCSTKPFSNQSLNISHTGHNAQRYFLQNVTESSSNQTKRLEKCEILSGDNHSIPCTEWEYDLSGYRRTIVSEWDLVCDKAWLVSFSKSVYMIGYMSSILVLGQISDWFGRYPVIICSFIILTTAAITSPFSSSYVMFLILRFFGGFGRTGITTTEFVLLMEIVGPNWRAELGFGVQLAWSLGYVILPGIALLVKEWFYLQLTLALPLLSLVFLFWIMPESPRWLLTQRKREKFEKMMKEASKKNGHGISSNVENSMATFWENQDLGLTVKKKTLLNVIKESHLRKKLLALFFICLLIIFSVNTGSILSDIISLYYFNYCGQIYKEKASRNLIYTGVVNSFVYYGLSFNTNRLAGDPYLNFFLSGIVEFPAVFGFMYAVRIFGRKKTLSAGMIAAGIFCASVAAVPANMQGLIVTFAMLAKLCITGTYQVAYICTAELFPTVVRNVTLGSCSTFARLGPILAPFMRDLGHATQEFVPDVLNAVLTISAGLLVLTLPETKDRILDTLEEGRHQ